MANTTMMFPNTVREFMEQFKMVDTEQIYSNGIEYVPIFRMEQWFAHQTDTPRWIPVTERLPDINDHYTSDVCLVYCDNGAYAFAELEENIFGQVGWDCEREDDYHEAVGTVVAWMLLPTPYKSGEEE